MARSLHIYLPQEWREKALAGQLRLFDHLAAALPGWQLRFHAKAPLARWLSPLRPGYKLFHKSDPPERRGLSFRASYFYPFWQFEHRCHRWEFDVAGASFDPAGVPAKPAAQLLQRLKRKLPGAGPIREQGFIFVPLQGRLLSHRSFQSMSPVQMIEATLAHDPRPIRATLHPLERYSDAERRALAELEARHPRFQLSKTDSGSLLRQCDLVVTQNSALAFAGFVAAKRAILFAQSDCHHIAGSVPRDGVAAAFASLQEPPPDFAGYLFWFLRQNCVDMAAKDAPAQLRARIGALGWPV